MILSRSFLAIVMIAALLVLGLSGGAEAAGRPDLVVPAGGAATQSGDQVKAVFRVKAKYAGTKVATRAGLGLYSTQSGEFEELGQVRVASLSKGTSRQVTIRGSLAGAAPGTYQLLGCADYWAKVKERNESNNCRVIGTATVDGGGGGELCETVNCDPLQVTKNEVDEYTDETGTYWVYVPDDNNPAPFKVLITLHGCGGESRFAPWNDADYYGYHYITIAPDGAELECWAPDQPNSRKGEKRVLDTVRSVTAHFNIDPRQIILNGYSSGGDLAYRTAFYHAELFAGVLAANTSPFRDTGSSPASSLAAASWKFNIRHLHATGDTTYPLAPSGDYAGVRAEIQQLKNAGFPAELEEMPGTHYDNPTNPDNPGDGTFWYIQRRLVQEYMNDGWMSPAP